MQHQLILHHNFMLCDDSTGYWEVRRTLSFLMIVMKIYGFKFFGMKPKTTLNLVKPARINISIYEECLKCVPHVHYIVRCFWLFIAGIDPYIILTSMFCYSSVHWIASYNNLQNYACVTYRNFDSGSSNNSICIKSTWFLLLFLSTINK